MKVKPVMFKAEANTFRLDDAHMDYTIFGKGNKTLLIIPGLTDSLQNVRKSIHVLAFSYRKYAHMYRVYVCSRKTPLPKGYTTREMAKDLKLFMDAQQITHADVIGVSMGGMIAQHLAADYPQSVQKMIIALSSAESTVKSNEVISYCIEMAKEGHFEDLTIDMMEKSFTDHYLWKYRPLYFLLRKAGKPKNTENFIKQAEACLYHNAYERLPMIECSTLVIGGEKDQILGGDASRVIASQITGSRLIMYGHLGHGALQEDSQFEKDSMEFLINHDKT